MIKLIICDDNPSALSEYQMLLEKIADENDVAIKIMRCESGEQLLFMLSDNPNNVDIIYLDILMGKMNGVEVAKKLRAIGCTAQIIYLTTSDEYVFEALDTGPHHYIVKDSVSSQKFKDIFLKCVEKVKKSADECFSVKIGTTYTKLQLDSILYFEVRNHLITIHLMDDSINYYAKIDDLEQMLSEKNFVRVHRSYLVNCYHIQEMLRTQLKLTDGTTLAVGSKYEKHLQEVFASYLLNL